MTQSFRILSIFILTLFALPSWAEDEEGSTVPQAIYYAFDEPFTINFLNQSNKKARYLQIKVTLKGIDQPSIDAAEQNLPMLQDALLDLFSDQSHEQVNSIEGRKALQQNTLETVRSLLKEETGNDAIDAVYFTSFILQ
jgi:flagellar FliL protein